MCILDFVNVVLFKLAYLIFLLSFKFLKELLVFGFLVSIALSLMTLVNSGMYLLSVVKNADFLDTFVCFPQNGNDTVLTYLSRTIDLIRGNNDLFVLWTLPIGIISAAQ